ncbi:hypothetical protein U91I_00896 [alpha proteobacterium U9-1i]|nr:hypothetical protein U91I_00896 [alpha proteobacterium U9-1i]
MLLVRNVAKVLYGEVLGLVFHTPLIPEQHARADVEKD